MKRSLFLLATLSLSLFAADSSGTWKGTAETQNGTIETIADAKVEGEDVSFTIMDLAATSWRNILRRNCLKSTV